MKIIEVLSEKIQEEIGDAKDYAKLALDYKTEYPELAKDFYSLSLQEMEHSNVLHNQVTTLIQRYKEKNGEPPANMLAVYEYLHKQQIDKSLEVKMLQSMFKGV